ncbi:zinc finger protein 91-like [Carassius auratus]|uniref:Zinc finger protein 91-like n=1 Tax=Carassius auratus TaxID=7957 RepID=A0A6P6N9S4_CARAU|nr:zinc finger protein 91-like [Carassius auratus]
MANDSSVDNGSLQSNNECLSSEYEKGAAQEINIDPVSNSKANNARNTDGEMEKSPSGPVLKAQDHAEVVAANAADPAIKIKVEQMEEDEYVVVHIDEEGNLAYISNVNSGGDSSERDTSTEGDWPFPSEDCSEAFGNKEDYLGDHSEHIHDGPIVCLDTDSQWDDLLISTNRGQRTMFCALCGQKFSSSKRFFSHQLMHRRQVNTRGIDKGSVRHKRFECKDCGKAYTSIGRCLNHQRSHKQASKSVFHQLANLKKKSFQCPTCGRCYSRASALDAHRRCHEVKLVKSKSCEKEKTLSLDEAPGQTEDNGTSSEQNEEHEQKVFQCICGKSFRTMSGLGTHQRFCSEGKLKEGIKHSCVCSECGKTFVRSKALLSHQLWHKRRTQLVCNGQPYKCTECDKDFTSLAFYNKHQRLAHSKDLPVKVIKLKKKAFECEECGRQFSRASALQSHQLCHTDVFCDTVEEHEAVDVNHIVVQITASDESSPESSSDLSQDQNSDLELVCESDHEGKDGLGFNPSQTECTSSLQLNPEIDVKIVKIDYEHLNDEPFINAELISKISPQEAKYNCPHCDRKFVKALSLRCHILWHKGTLGKKSYGRKKFDKLMPTKRPHITCEVCGHESASKSAHNVHMGQHEDKVAYKSISYQLANLQKNNIKCEECGKTFSRLSALHSHQQHHNNSKKPFACLECDKRYTNANGLYKHKTFCSGSAKGEKTKQFNPTKSLLGPKVHHCKKCGKGFWSLGAFFHHMQNHLECANVEMGPSGPPDSENDHMRGKKRGPRGCYKKVQKNKIQKWENNSYQCPDCRKFFSHAMALQFHMKSHGFETGLPSIDTDSFEQPQCPTCYEIFASKSKLQNHQKQCSLQDHVEFPEECGNVGIDASLQKAEDVCDSSHSADSEREQKTSLDSDKKYKCQHCSRSFSVIGALNFHKRIHSIGDQSKKLYSHSAKQLKLVKGKSETFACADCGRYFSSNSALGTHRRWHKDKTFARFLSKTNKSRSRKNVDDGPYLCKMCGKGFFYLCALRRHQLHHPPMEAQPQKEPEAPESNSVFTCPDCQMSFSSGSLLITHLAEHHSKSTEKLQSEILHTDELVTPIKQPHTSKTNVTKQEKTVVLPYKCSNCYRRFLNIRGLSSHISQKHRNFVKQTACSLEESLAYKKPFASESTLPKMFTEKTSLEEEPVQRSQNIERSFFKCDKCAEAFPSEEQLNAHKEASKTRPHCCSLCCRGYWTANQLQQHLAWHHEARQHLPNELQYRPSASMTPGPSDNLQALSHRSESLVKLPVALVSPQLGSHKCQQCGKTFLSPRALQQHQTLHKNAEPYHCSLCSQTFSDIRSLTDHHQECLGDKELKDRDSTSTVRGEVNLTCIECGIFFKQETELHQHYIEHARGL